MTGRRLLLGALAVGLAALLSGCYQPYGYPGYYGAYGYGYSSPVYYGGVGTATAGPGGMVAITAAATAGAAVTAGAADMGGAAGTDGAAAVSMAVDSMAAALAAVPGIISSPRLRD